MLTFKKYIQTIERFEEAWVLLAALRFNIYSILGKEELTGKKIAQKTKTNEEGMACLLNALVALKALYKKNNKYSNTPEMYKHFCSTSPSFKKGTIFLKANGNDEWKKLINTIQKGRDISEYEKEDDPNFRYLFSHAMHERSFPFANKIAEILNKGSIKKFLDFGGGPGSYCSALLKKNEKLETYLFDRPTAIKVAKELNEKQKYFKRLKFIEGDLFKTKFGQNYDTVLFSNILHIYNPTQNKRLFRRIHKSLIKGGRLAIVEFFINENRIEPYDAVMFSLTMLLYTATGKTYSYNETEALLKETGYYKFKRIQLDNSVGILIAHKNN